MWLPDSVVLIGCYAFHGCMGLVDLYLPTALQSIGRRAFYICTGIFELHLPATLQSIGSEAFRGCTEIVDVGAFPGCTGVPGRRVVLDGGTEIADGAYRNRKDPQEVWLPDSVVKIGEGAFYGCTSFVDLHLPATLRSRAS